jgi:NADPH-dependent glutamate synthase beta subunit-like oxidoreductase
MKLEKQGVVNRRVELLKEEGITFRVNQTIGDGRNGTVDVRELRQSYDAVLLATGATTPRDLRIPGRELDGVHFAMEFLTANTRCLLDTGNAGSSPISARGKHVVVIGGGDTGTDCIGTALRHGCRSLVNFEVVPQAPESRAENNPWPGWPRIHRTDYGHEESRTVFGSDPRIYQISSVEFVGARGKLKAVRTVEVDLNEGQFVPRADSEREWPADLVLLAMGFTGPEHGCSNPLAISYDQRSNYLAEYGKFLTSEEGVFAAGDCRRGQSLVVWAINEGREAAREIDRALMGQTQLP